MHLLRNNLGHFDQIRSTETEELQTQSDDDEDKKAELEEVKRQLEEKDRELEDLRKAKQDAEIEKEEKMAQSEALDSALGKSLIPYESYLVLLLGKSHLLAECQRKLFEYFFRIAEKAIRRR